MSASTFHWIILAIAVTVILGALRVPRGLVGVLCLIALPAMLIYTIQSPDNSSPNVKAAIMIWGTLFVVFVAPIAGVVGFFGAWLGKEMTDKRRGARKIETGIKQISPTLTKVNVPRTNRQWMIPAFVLSVFVFFVWNIYHNDIVEEEEPPLALRYVSGNSQLMKLAGDSEPRIEYHSAHEWSGSTYSIELKPPIDDKSGPTTAIVRSIRKISGTEFVVMCVTTSYSSTKTDCNDHVITMPSPTMGNAAPTSSQKAR